MKTLILLLASAPWALAVSNSVTFTDLTASTQTNRVFTTSRVFAKGEIPHYARPRISGTPLSVWQCDRKSTWSDGSLMWGLISYTGTVPSSSTLTVDFVDDASSSSAGSALSEPAMLTFNSSNWNVGASLTVSGNTQSVDARTIIADDIAAGKSCGNAGSRCKYWLQGPVVTQAIIEGPLDDPTHAFDYDIGWGTNCSGSPCKPLHPRFVLTFYAGWAGVQEEFVIECLWTTKLEEWTYDVVVKSGAALGTTQYSKTGLYHYATARYRKYFWDGSAPGAVKTDHNLPYLTSTGMLLNYDWAGVGTLAPSALAAEQAFWNGSDKGVDLTSEWSSGPYVYSANTFHNMPNTGGRQDIGPTTTWVADYLFSWDPTLEAMVRGNADVGGHVPNKLRESRVGSDLYCGHSCTGGNASTPAFGHWVSVDARPTAMYSRYGVNWCFSETTCRNAAVAADRITPIVMATEAQVWHWTTDIEHHPDTAYMPLVLFGDYFYYEELQAWVHYLYVRNNPGTFINYGRHQWWAAITVNKDQGRGIAWAMRDMASALLMAVDGTPEKEMFQSKWNWNAEIFEGYMNITNGNFPPVNSACPGFNPTTGTDKWCWGRLVANCKTSSGSMTSCTGNLGTPLIFPTAGSDSVSSYPWLNQTNTAAASADWMNNYASVVWGWAEDRDLRQFEFTRKKLAAGYLKILFDPTSNPYLGGLYRSTGTLTSGYPTTVADWFGNFVNGQTICAGPPAVPFNSATTFWMGGVTCAQYNNLDDGYPIIYRGAISYWGGITATPTSGPTLTGEAAWTWVNDPARALSTAALNTDPKWAYIPRGTAPPSCDITTSSLPAGTLGAAYSQTLTTSGCTAPIAFTIAAGSLCTGLSIGSSTGTISGTPLVPGTCSFTVQATDNGGNIGLKPLSILIPSVPGLTWRGLLLRSLIGR